VTKQDFVDAVADRAGISKRDAGEAVDAVLDTITDTLKAGDSVTFTGFGKFSISQRAARMGVNPRTGERVQIQATTVPKFTAGSALKTAVKSGSPSSAPM
jgi:DNA-binding protein HU-beta